MIDLPNQKERAPVWGRLGMPLSEKDTTDTETGETTTLLGSNTIQSPEGGQADEEEWPRRKMEGISGDPSPPLSCDQ